MLNKNVCRYMNMIVFTGSLVWFGWLEGTLRDAKLMLEKCENMFMCSLMPKSTAKSVQYAGWTGEVGQILVLCCMFAQAAVPFMICQKLHGEVHHATCAKIDTTLVADPEITGGIQFNPAWVGSTFWILPGVWVSMVKLFQKPWTPNPCKLHLLGHFEEYRWRKQGLGKS